MVEKITSGIQVIVRTLFRVRHTRSDSCFYLFSYFIQIKNTTNEPVQLLRRHWMIVDADGEYSEVEGPGVVGEQPVFLPGETYAYESACCFKYPLGKMHGKYLFEKLNSQENFFVDIPEFTLIAPHLLN